MTDRPFRDEPTEVLETALGLADTHTQQAARFQHAQPGDELPAVADLFRAELQHREGSVTSNCPNCQHPQHLPGTECDARIDHGPSRFHACLCLARPGAANACPPQMTCQGGTLGYADIWYLQHGHTLSSADGAISPEVLADGPASAAVPPAPADADLRDRIRRACAEADGFRFEGLEPHDYQKHADAILALLPPSAYRRLLARLEADRAGHLRATVRATEAGEAELVAVGGASAAACRHAAAMAVRAFEGPDAAQAYMQRTEGGEGPPFDVEAGLQRLADAAERGEAGEPIGPSVAPPPALTEAGQLRMRIEELEEALRRADSLAQLGATCMRMSHTGQIERATAVMNGWRFAMAIALGLEGDAPWEAIHERMAELRRMADEAQQAGDVEAEPKRTPMDPVHILDVDSEDPEGSAALRARLLSRPTPAVRADVARQAEPWDAPDARPGTTDYTLQQRHEQADRVHDERVAAAKEQQAKARQACPCGQPGCEYCDVEDDDADETGEVVAYRNSDRPGVLLCREHGDGWMGLTPLTADDLPDGGLCTECGVDVLIPQQQAGEGR